MVCAGRAKRGSLMQRRRFYASREAIDERRIVLSSDESHHLLRVLRLTRGDVVFAFDGLGNEYLCEFIAVEGRQAVLEILEALSDEVESPLQLTLAQALVKGEKFDVIVQKATELGVSRIVPIATEHADLKVNREQTRKKIERWQRISLEALKQCGRRRLVEITLPLTLDEFLEAGTESRAIGNISQSARIFFNERGGALLHKALAESTDKSRVTALIGPEGGWSDAEIELMTGHGCLAVTLGRRIVRTETAAVVAVALLQHLLGDLSNDKAASAKEGDEPCGQT
jgi:16S rRNA (uracil1498-N3)-methyltransferase